MEPIPETTEAVEEYGPFASEDGDLIDELRASSVRVRELIPECIGMTLASVKDGVSFTLVASDEEIAVLDAIQYVAGGPCVEAVKAERVLTYTHEELMEEGSWLLFAQATAATGLASTLTLPIVVEGQVSGSINLYATTRDAFDGRHEEVAEVFHAWAPGAVANADLGFSTRAVAEQAPLVLREQVHVQVALGMVMNDQGIDIETARSWLHDAAQRAGVTVAMVAERLALEARRVDE